MMEPIHDRKVAVAAPKNAKANPHWIAPAFVTAATAVGSCASAAAGASARTAAAKEVEVFMSRKEKKINKVLRNSATKWIERPASTFKELTEELDELETTRVDEASQRI
jgi:hypothetical protein